MGTASAHPISAEDKARIKAVYLPPKATPTHNGDGLESPLEVLYRAASVARQGRTPTNLRRQLPGGVTVGAILRRAGITGEKGESK